MAKFKPYFEIDIPKEYGPDERRAIAAEIIDEIIKRTESGLDANGDKFQKYSKEYAKEKGQSNVDLTFSGDMLAQIELLQERSGKLRIGIDPGYEGIGKVEGNVLGTYGNNSPVTKPRNFLGITENELKRITKNYPVDDKAERKQRVAEITTADIVAREILNQVGFDDEA